MLFLVLDFIMPLPDKFPAGAHVCYICYNIIHIIPTYQTVFANSYDSYVFLGCFNLIFKKSIVQLKFEYYSKPETKLHNIWLKI